MTKRATSIFVLVSILGCNDRLDTLPAFELSGATMGTRYSIKLVGPAETVDKDALQDRLTYLLLEIEQRMSTYLVDSELSLLNLNPSTDWIEVSAELCNIVASALDISRLTNGAFDITVAPLVDLWGFGPGAYVSAPPSEREVSRARRRVGYGKLNSDCHVPAIQKSRSDVHVDLSAYAKGYAVDRIAEVLDETGVQNYLVEIGGELRLRGRNASGDKWLVAIEKPLAYERDVQATFRMTNVAVATSGDYRNYFEYLGERYSHTIDSRSGRPVTHSVSAVTVVHEEAAFADAIATALLVLGLESGLQLAEREKIAAYFLLRNESDIEEHMSSRFAELYDK